MSLGGVLGLGPLAVPTYSSWVAKVHLEVSSFLRAQGVRRADPVLVAVSGGADSSALLQILVALGQRVGVAHVHHGLRGPEANADLEFVRARAHALGVPSLFARVNAAARDGRSPEARARALRYAALEELREQGDYRYIATAHQLDDQAETVILRAIRGTGPVGMAGIAPRSADGRLLRPLLRIRREELRAYLRERGLPWRDDESNQDLAIPRNRLRAEVIPVLEAIHPVAVRKLGELTESAREAAMWMQDAVVPVLEQALEERDGGVWIDPASLVSLAPALRMRALAELFVRRGLSERISGSHLERVARFFEWAESGKTLSLPQGMLLFCDRDRFWLGPEPGPCFPPSFSAVLRPPESLELPERDLRLTWRRVASRGSGLESLRVPGDPLSPLIVRSPLPGDRMRPSEKVRTVPLQDLFSAARWSRRARARAVVVEWAKEVVWVVGLARRQIEHSMGDSGWELVAEPLSSYPESC